MVDDADAAAGEQRPLWQRWPAITGQYPPCSLGDFPSALQPLSDLVDELRDVAGAAYVKRDDVSSSVYGGNKVRTLESLFGRARVLGCHEVWSTGAFGSNHALATALHAPRAGLSAGALLFPQPQSRTARDNLRAVLGHAQDVRALPHWSLLPAGVVMLSRSLKRQRRPAMIMVPGGANVVGALGYVSAALELAAQVDQGQAPPPSQVIVGVGSTCTSAGLLLGMCVAHRLKLGFPRTRPLLTSVRVTPWPVTSRYRIVSLAARTAAFLFELTRDPVFRVRRSELAESLRVVGEYIGAGYGRITPAGLDAIDRFAAWGKAALDTTYSAKSAAALYDQLKASDEPLVYWATKSSVPLPHTSQPLTGPRRMLRWLETGEERCQHEFD